MKSNRMMKTIKLQPCQTVAYNVSESSVLKYQLELSVNLKFKLK